MRLLQILKVSLLAAFLAAAAARAAEPAGSQEDWRVEFEAVCSQTDNSMSLAGEELAQLIARCDKLIEKIGAEAEVVRRVYLKRLKNCRELFAFVLASRAAEPAGGPGAAPPQAAGAASAESAPAAAASPGGEAPPASEPAAPPR